jgi:magnesium transporter
VSTDSAVECRLVDKSGASDDQELTREALEERLAGGFFWLDVRRPTREQVKLIGETFGFHPLAVEDSLKFGQRPKVEDYGDVQFIVLYGHAPDDDGLVEVHVYASERFVVTIRRDAAPALDDLHRLYEKRYKAPEYAGELLYRLADALVDSFFPPLAEFDERLDLIEDALITQPRDEHLTDIFTMRRRLARLRRVLMPQRDLVGKFAAGAFVLPGSDTETERYFRDVYDHLIRLNEQIEVTRETMTVAIDVYLTASNNRLNDVMKRLTVIATVFLPLTFVTGFFGQNFGWMVKHVGSAGSFVAFGLGSQLLVLALLVVWFRRRGWWS